MRLYTFASSSEGNCLLVQSEKVNILLDFGLSYKKIVEHLKSLNLSIQDITGILITHEHTDHVRGLQTLVKHAAIPIYCTPATARQLEYKIAGISPLLNHFSPEMSKFFKDIRVTSFPTSHDSAQSADYTFAQKGHTIGCLTDTGIITAEAEKALLGCELCYLESNHDVNMLQSGPYPYMLQQRILGDQGHLCNEVSANFAVKLAQNGCKTILLAHLSKENNTPRQALSVANTFLKDYPVSVSVAARDALCGPFTVGE